MAAKTFGKGTLLQREDSPASGTYTTVAQVKSISGPTLESEEVDVTNHDSSGSFREFIGGLIDGGEITGELVFDPNDATHDGATGLFADLQARTVREWRIRIPTTPTVDIIFDGFVKAFPMSFPFDAAITANFTIRVTGAPTMS